jgi:hypothetical protein
MMNEIHQKIKSGRGINFNFLFDKLHIKAKAEKVDDKFYIKEVVGCYEKEIKCNNTAVLHPSLAEYEKGSEEKVKQWTSVEKGNAGTELVGDKTSTPGILDVEKENEIIDEYRSDMGIERVRIKRSGGAKTTSQTKPVDKNKKNTRTTGDIGGGDTVPQLEFEQKIAEKPEGPFADILQILKLIMNEPQIANVEYHVGFLNEHYRKRAICTLDDGVTPRKYLAAKIQGVSGKEAVIIEIEKENLSTLMLLSSNYQDWNCICHKVIKGLILKSGVWPDFSESDFVGLGVNRFKHTSADIDIREKRIVSRMDFN